MLPPQAVKIIVAPNAPSLHDSVTSIPTTAAVMTPVANHPIKRKAPVTVNWPMTLVLAVRSIIRTITGTATTPLMTADQNRAWIGLNDVKFNATQPKWQWLWSYKKPWLEEAVALVRSATSALHR